jgi:Holliday junction DNA helicase RuvA
MIARLSGLLAETSAEGAIIDVGGVGYLVHASVRTLDALGPIGGEVVILTELQVREDGWTLFGFGSAGERDTFRALTSVQGVGGRVALAILSSAVAGRIGPRGRQDDKAMIGRANGVGPKLAARIANELKGKLGVAGLGGSTRLPRAGAAADACPPSPISASNPPTPAPRSTRPKTSWGWTQGSMRWCGWRCGKRRSERRKPHLASFR